MDNRYHNFINWKSYYYDSQVKEYNLRNTYCVNLFNTNDLNMPGDNQINYLNPYLGELPMMYYIWKNNFKSDYICISQYRRDFTYIDFDELDKGKIQCYNLYYHGFKMNEIISYAFDPNGYCKEKLYSFLCKKYGMTNEDIENIKNKTEYSAFSKIMFAMNWDKFCEVCEFMFGYLDELFPNDGWKNIEVLEDFRQKQTVIFNDKEDVPWPLKFGRYIPFLQEEINSKLFPVLFDVFKNDGYEQNTVICTHFEDGFNEKALDKFYKLAIKLNPLYICFKIKNEDADKAQEYSGAYNAWVYQKLKFIKENEEILNEYGKVPEKIIELNIDEYIDVDHPIDLHEGRYNIKKIVY